MTDPPQRILIIRPSALGDVARTTPVLVSLRRNYPDAQIDWLVRDTFVDAISAHPDLNDAIPFPRSRFRRFGWHPRVTLEVLRYLRDLRRRDYDLVYDLQGLGRSGALTWVTRAAQRYGPTDAREFAWAGYNRRIKVDPAIEHTVDRMLAVIEAGGVRPVRDLTLYVGESDRAWVDRFIAQNNLSPRRYAVIAPTAQWLSKCWPIDRFGMIADRLKEVGCDACVIVGSQSERPWTAPLTDATNESTVRRVNMVGQTSVGQLMGVIQQSGLVIANDSAALHLAVGLGRRCIGIFGPTNPRQVGPYRYDIAVVQADGADGVHYRAAKDDQTVIARVSVEQAWTALQRVMQSDPPLTCH